MKVISLLSKFFCCLLITIAFCIKVNAANDYQFSIDYQIDYNISETGETDVTQKTVITNLVNEVIPTTYTFTSKQLKINDVSATSNGKSSYVKTEEKDGDTLISVTISNYAIGKGKKNEVVLKYKTSDIAQKSGKIWNIYIPKIQIPETTSEYDVKLSVPVSLGPKIYLSPIPNNEKIEENKFLFTFNKNSFTTSGITAAFGEYQPVNFKLKYQLGNSFILPLIKEIALPLDVSGKQQVSFQNITPKPLRIKRGRDGNFLAAYIVAPFQKREVEVTGTAKLYGKQINPDLGMGLSDLPKQLVKTYTKPEKYWEVKSSAVKKVASELKDEKLNVSQNAQNIYNFITNNLSYNFEAPQKGLVERKGAETVLTQESKWTCMEFTDLFITLARAMGIPAREVNGYALAESNAKLPLSISFGGGDFLHSWPEFYDNYYGWVQVDPTWGTTSGVDYFTKTDTNHLAFVVKGLSSEYPFSAGTYRFKNDCDDKLIETALSQNIIEENFVPKLTVRKSPNWNLFQRILGKSSKYQIENTGGVVIYDLSGFTLFPTSEKNIFLGKETKYIEYKDVNGKIYKLDL